MLLVLQRSPEQEVGLRSLLDGQQDPSSPLYHAWLTPDQFGQQFGPGDADLQIVTAWLTSHGFKVNGIANGRTVIQFSGTAEQLTEAFHTEIHKYSVNGSEHWANVSDPQIPAGPCACN
jgi:subtilase family serine protease